MTRKRYEEAFKIRLRKKDRELLDMIAETHKLSRAKAIRVSLAAMGQELGIVDAVDFLKKD